MGLRGDVRLRDDRAQTTPQGSVDRSPGRIRGDIEGLRAVAVLMVLLYHAGAPFLPGGFVGVDVFFVISGFLITTLLIRELARTGTISLRGFYARRFKRLLPAAAALLLFVTVATPLLLPRTRWASTAWDVVASSLYSINWRLASRSVDYLAQGEAPSPLQHFWSLAVEEQFYLVWPLLILLATWGVRGRFQEGRHRAAGGSGTASTRQLTTALLLGLSVVAVPSLAWSIHLTAAEQGTAYFVTTTRMWELAIGGGIAIGAAQLARMPRRAAARMGWTGLAAVLGTGLILTTATPFPGAVALIPTLGTAAVIASGPAAGRSGPVRLLGSAPMRWVGGLSYSLYLWHWPLIVLATAWIGRPLTLPEGLAVVTASFAPAWLSRRYVEEPVRRSRPLTARPILALRLGLALTCVGVFSGLGLLAAVWLESAPPAAVLVPRLPSGDGKVAAASTRLGAEVLGDSPRADPRGIAVDRVPSITPDILIAKQDWDHDCALTGRREAEVSTCAYGRPDARPRVLVLGDSHAHQWMPAMKAIAEADDWRVVSHTKSSCPFVSSEVASRGRPYSSCNEWNRAVRRTLATSPRPDLVILTSRSFQLVEGGRILTGQANNGKAVEAMRSAIREFTDAGVPVVVLRDTPASRVNIPDCVASHTDHLTACATPRSAALRGSEQVAAAEGIASAHLVDLTDAICPGDPCAPVIGGVLLMRDYHHLTRTYVQSLAPRLQALLRPLVDEHQGLPASES